MFSVYTWDYLSQKENMGEKKGERRPQETKKNPLLGPGFTERLPSHYHPDGRWLVAARNNTRLSAPPPRPESWLKSSCINKSSLRNLERKT
ncbi:hypothetical protein E2C01_059824 [Portunus trituberculatus]|uniref:Uncharacterized protein n=1 Tax=Portunus trituberculatus TaxID=210409 RepID=A0A5B7H9Q4_PORTR|nr:hypothetical protein [Portunus trituberculatus]